MYSTIIIMMILLEVRIGEERGARKRGEKISVLSSTPFYFYPSL